ncbi:MAG: glycine cleavage system protein GcvH [Erysipelotrichaceae bacterium]|nr:glycine cleavage system protein GcvH [Erysipelotrichaceae bacterium]MDO5120583.1 glycine cleavage system protein GcvH [Erysipelotrichaceae bacterium]
MKTPVELKYTATHEWVKEDNGTYLMGITDYAQDQLGSLVYINLPMEGDAMTAGEAFCDVESVKAVSDIMAPLSGTVTEVNSELEDAPQKLNEDPYGAWICRFEAEGEAEGLLSAEEYAALCEKEAK